MSFMFAKRAPTVETKTQGETWKLAVVDDEQAVHDVTRLALRGFEFDGRGLEILSALSAKEARELFQQHDDIALVLLDVVMESDEAGLQLVDYLRKDLARTDLRIVLRTGQPGQAPERAVIDRYDINDYKEKTELTNTRLYTVVRTGIQAFQHIRTLNGHKKALEFMALQAPKLFQLSSLHTFFDNLLVTLETLLPMLTGSREGPRFSGFIAYPIEPNGDFKVFISKGYFAGGREAAEVITKKAMAQRPGGRNLDGGFVLPILDRNETRGMIFISQVKELSEYEHRLLDILAMEAMVTFRNIDLYELLAKERNETIDMLAVAAEYKDETTGEHVKRVEKLTRLLALEMGFAEEEATHMARASLLHDIGKLAVADSILRREGDLPADEFELIKRHTIKGYTLLEGRAAFELERVIALTHHERYDGKGYPNGLKGEDIPLPGRIVALADVYDALANPRPYKNAWPKESVHLYIRENRGIQFDPQVVDAFFRMEARSEASY